MAMLLKPRSRKLELAEAKRERRLLKDRAPDCEAPVIRWLQRVLRHCRRPMQVTLNWLSADACRWLFTDFQVNRPVRVTITGDPTQTWAESRWTYKPGFEDRTLLLQVPSCLVGEHNDLAVIQAYMRLLVSCAMERGR